jgi:hypothetical protein
MKLQFSAARLSDFSTMGSHLHKADTTLCRGLVSLALLSFPFHGATADAINPALDDQFTIRLGFLHNEIEGTVTVLRQPLPETPVDVEDVGLDTSQTSPWASIRWRFGERWALNFHYDRFDQDGKHKVETEFNFDGVIYPVGARIDTKFRADAYILDVSYALWQGRDYELGVGVGVHAFDLDMGIRGSIKVGEEEGEIGRAQEELIAPVPNLRLFGIYAFSPKVSVSASAGWLSASYEDWDGEFLYLRGLVEYRFSESWGLGGGYQFTDVDVEHNRDGGDFEKYDVELSGWQGYITYSF